MVNHFAQRRRIRATRSLLGSIGDDTAETAHYASQQETHCGAA
jgi:hypothetical protein